MQRDAIWISSHVSLNCGPFGGVHGYVNFHTVHQNAVNIIVNVLVIAAWPTRPSGEHGPKR